LDNFRRVHVHAANHNSIYYSIRPCEGVNNADCGVDDVSSALAYFEADILVHEHIKKRKVYKNKIK